MHMRSRMWALNLMVWSLFLLGAGGGTAAGNEGGRALLFTAVNCPHCREGEEFLGKLEEKYPSFRVSEYEVWQQPENVQLLLALSRSHGWETFSTPAIFIGDRVWFGFTPGIAREVEEEAVRCVLRGCPDPLSRLKEKGGGIDTSHPSQPAAAQERITLPLLGELEAERVSLPLLTLVLGLLDSFNPCAFFVLLFLLGLLLHIRSRRRMFLVGGTFILCSGLVYFLFMAAWLNFFLLVGELRAVTAAAGVVALLAGGLNVKDFFYFRRGFSLSIPERVKPRLFDRMRRLVRATRLSSVLAGTAILAVAANSYEILCTAGFPMVYTRVLTLHELPRWQFYSYLGLYNLFYILPLLAIVLVFSLTLGKRQLTEWEGRVLKLVSGTMMLLLGAVLLVQPELLNHLASALFLLILALGISAAVILLQRRASK